jgi:thiamine transporter
MSKNTKRLVESAILIALGTVLSLFSFSGPWALGGGITICSMLPLVILAQRYGTRWGVFSALVYAVLQMILGFSNVQYAQNVWQAIAIILFDYIIAFGVIGFSAAFNGVIKNRPVSIAVGTIVTLLGRLACHFISGWVIWEALWPNELGWAAPVWSIAYNASYMIPEILITTIAAVALYVPLKRYYRGEDLAK